MRIYLTGFMGAGKTTVGRILAAEIGCPFLDLDRQIEESSGKRIEEIFVDEGEAAFRSRERDALAAIRSETILVSTGAGCYIQHFELMKGTGVVVFIDAPFEILARRIGADPARPLWRKGHELYDARRPQYLTADIIVDGSGSPDDVAAAISDALKTFRRET